MALEPFRIANRYGLFGIMTRGRYEIEFQGSDDGKNWVPYPFRYKPQDVASHRAFMRPISRDSTGISGSLRWDHGGTIRSCPEPKCDCFRITATFSIFSRESVSECSSAPGASCGLAILVHDHVGKTDAGSVVAPCNSWPVCSDDRARTDGKIRAIEWPTVASASECSPSTSPLVVGVNAAS